MLMLYLGVIGKSIPFLVGWWFWQLCGSGYGVC